MEPFVQTGERYLTIQEWQRAHPHLIVGFSTRRGGKSNNSYNSLNLGFHVGDDPESVKSNRRLLATDIQFPLSRWVGTEQVHESSIKKITLLEAGCGSERLDTAIANTDGIYTLERNLLLTSLYADCVPLYFFAPSQGAIGLAHAGWRGTVQNIGSAMIRKWTMEEGIPLEDIQVAIGPCISQPAYEVDHKVITEVQKCWPNDLNYLPYRKRSNEKYLLDLREVNKALIRKAGINNNQILMSSICTATDERMFSHRAEAGRTGRLMSFIGIRLDGDE
ncbi:peptidoglycan editing factor PgeF [Halalkalibacter kiskunsagensis]|uniref:Purine nucleoside phosphorylase n=1 Tax=Halalkalibacter kiskunsagensis TaxID=1548599 RepID=A0ABV6KIE1_9BACI